MSVCLDRVLALALADHKVDVDVKIDAFVLVLLPLPFEIVEKSRVVGKIESGLGIMVLGDISGILCISDIFGVFGNGGGV